jgi:hypothetical protein
MSLTAIVLDHVAPFAGRPIPERGNHYTFKVTLPTGHDYGLAALSAGPTAEVRG